MKTTPVAAHVRADAATDEDDAIHRDLYDKVNANTAAMSELRAELRVTNIQNAQLIDLLREQNRQQSRTFKWIAAGLFILILFLSAALCYGAIGERGLHAVRENMPTFPYQTVTDIIPWHDDKHGWPAKAAA